MPELEQWVNLDEKPDFRGDGIDDVKRLGAIHFKFTFKKAKPSQFRVRLIPIGAAATYSDDERNRNEAFRARVTTSVLSNAAQSESVIDKAVHLPAAGGNKYKLQAIHKDKEVDSPVEVIVKRRLYYQVMAMKGMIAHSTATMDDAFLNPEKEVFIKMLSKDPGRDIPLMGVIEGDAKHDQFIRACGAQYSLAKYAPFSFGICFVKYIASSGETTVRHRLAANVPSKLGKWSWDGLQAELDIDQHLWHGFDDAEDLAQAWLLDIYVGFLATGAMVAEAVPRSELCISIVGPKEFTYGGYKKISVTVVDGAVKRKMASARQGEFIFEVKVKTAEGWTNGFAYTSINLIAIASRVLWKDMDAATREYTLNHEVGHKVGMVSDGTGKAAEKSPNHYTGNTHQGNHCSKGATFLGGYWSGAPGCVMFGANGAYSGVTLNAAPATFCPDCEPRVRKLDLSAISLSQTGFNQSMEKH